MHPFFRADIEEQSLTHEGTLELIEHLYINLTDNLSLYDNLTVENAAGFTQYQTLSLGGVDATGKDAWNRRLSFLCLEAAESVRSTQPDLVLLCHPRETPYNLKMKAVDLVQTGDGSSQVHQHGNTAHRADRSGVIRGRRRPRLDKGLLRALRAGVKTVRPYGRGVPQPSLSLEAVLFDGCTAAGKGSGRRLGASTGDPRAFTGSDQFMDAFKTQTARQVRDAHVAGSYMELAQGQHFPLMLQSVLTDNCIETGLAANAGGARINVRPGSLLPADRATVADSLAAIKRLVYEEKRMSMDQLIEAVASDFEGYEPLRRMLFEEAPKFGNDIDYVDDLATEVFQFASAEVRSHVGPFGNRNSPATAVSVSHISHGAFVGATPDGRKAGTPLRTTWSRK